MAWDVCGLNQSEGEGVSARIEAGVSADWGGEMAAPNVWVCVCVLRRHKVMRCFPTGAWEQSGIQRFQRDTAHKGSHCGVTVTVPARVLVMIIHNVVHRSF